MTQHNLFAGLIMLKQQIATPGAREGGRQGLWAIGIYVCPSVWMSYEATEYLHSNRDHKSANGRVGGHWLWLWLIGTASTASGLIFACNNLAIYTVIIFGKFLSSFCLSYTELLHRMNCQGCSTYMVIIQWFFHKCIRHRIGLHNFPLWHWNVNKFECLPISFCASLLWLSACRYRDWSQSEGREWLSEWHTDR